MPEYTATRIAQKWYLDTLTCEKVSLQAQIDVARLHATRAESGILSNTEKVRLNQLYNIQQFTQNYYLTLLAFGDNKG